MRIQELVNLIVFFNIVILIDYLVSKYKVRYLQKELNRVTFELREEKALQRFYENLYSRHNSENSTF